MCNPIPGNDQWKAPYGNMQIHDESQHTLRDLVNARGNVFACTNEFSDWEPDLVTVAPGSA